MKRLISSLALTAVLFGGSLVGLAPEAKASWTEYVCTDSTPLNVRSGASRGSRIIGSIPKGAWVVVHGVNYNSYMAYVTYGNTSGWVAYNYLCY